MAAIDLFGVLQEECAEVIKEVSKVRRSGPDFKPFNGETSNREHLHLEILDVLAILEIGYQCEFLDRPTKEELDAHVLSKIQALGKWTPLAISRETSLA